MDEIDGGGVITAQTEVQKQAYHEILAIKDRQYGPGKFALMNHIITSHLSPSGAQLAVWWMQFCLSVTFYWGDHNLSHWIVRGTTCAKNIANACSDPAYQLSEEELVNTLQRIPITQFTSEMAYDSALFKPVVCAFARRLGNPLRNADCKSPAAMRVRAVFGSY